MRIEQIHLRVLHRGTEKTILFSPEQNENGTSGLYFQEKDLPGGSLLEVSYQPDGEETLLQCQIHATEDYRNASILANGFQSWSISPECDKNSRIHQVNPLIRPLLGKYGDTCFHLPYRQRGVIHSHGFLRVRRPNVTELLATVDDSAGYTIFTVDMNRNRLLISKDCEGHVIRETMRIFALYETQGAEHQIFARWQSFFPATRRGIGPCTGWTSWYYFYTDISESKIMAVLDSYQKERVPLDYFQIDDGYQAHVGDWLVPNEKFASGMQKMAERIRAAGYKPGIWLAPFIAEKNSILAKEHPEWILRDEKGRKVHAGFNPGWSYRFYALDLYETGFRKYLRDVFQTVHKWGYEMVKLDFLYGAAVIPHHGKSRAAVMLDAVAFLDTCIGNKPFLACGVPTAAVFGRCDYCRIGSDVAPYWEDKKLAALHYRERVSTVASLKNTLSRYFLNGNAFYNDPDVFLLRDKNNRLTISERYTLFFVNNLLGSLVFTSDIIDAYTQDQRELFLSMFPKLQPEIHSFLTVDDRTTIDFTANGRQYLSHVNLSERPWSVELPKQLCFSQKTGLYRGGDTIVIPPHESTCFLLSKHHRIIGSTGYILPGADVSDTVDAAGRLVLQPISGLLQPGTVWIQISPNEEEMFIDGTLHVQYEEKGVRFAKVNRPQTRT